MKESLKIYLDKTSKHALKEEWVKKNLTDLWKFITDKYTGSIFSEKIYKHLNGDDTNKCKICNNKTKFLSLYRGYRIYCSKKCSNNDPNLTNKKLEQYKITCLEKYGFDSSSKSEEVKLKTSKSRSLLDKNIINEKMRNTCLERFGVDNASKSDIIKKKKIETTIKNFGVKNPFQSEDIKTKIKITFIDKYGFDHPMKSHEFSEKTKKTILSKYGVDNPMQSDVVKEKFKSTCLDRWESSHFQESKKFKKIKKERHIGELNKEHKEKDIDIKIIDSIESTYSMICDKCNSEFNIQCNAYNIRKNRNLEICINCNPIKSNSSLLETDLYKFILENYKSEIIRNFRLDNKEIDIYLPDLRIGFEFNGVYWHSEYYKENNYHFNKFDFFSKNGIRLIQVWEDDWIYQKDIIKSIILNKINSTPTKIFARKCKIVKISNKETNNFLNDNHIQGWCVSKLRYGLVYNNDLISIITFGKLRKNLGLKSTDSDFELLRFCNKINTSVTGGASKLLSHFIKENKPSSIITYSKNDYSDGNLYNKIGFKFDKLTNANYYWVVDGIRENRFNWRKDKLVKQGYDIKLTEVQIMHQLNRWRCFDSGNKKWILI